MGGLSGCGLEHSRLCSTDPKKEGVSARGEEEGMCYVDLTADCSFVLVDTSLAIDFVVITAPSLRLPLSL